MYKHQSSSSTLWSSINTSRRLGRLVAVNVLRSVRHFALEQRGAVRTTDSKVAKLWLIHLYDRAAANPLAVKGVNSLVKLAIAVIRMIMIIAPSVPG